MNRPPDPFAELREILEALCEERLTSAQGARLDELARHDPAARRFYLEYIELHGNLHWDAAQGGFAASGLESAKRSDSNDEARNPNDVGSSNPPTSKGNKKALPAPVPGLKDSMRLATVANQGAPLRRPRVPIGLVVVAGAAIVAVLAVAVWLPPVSRPLAEKPPALPSPPPALAAEHRERGPAIEHAAGSDRGQRSPSAPPTSDAARGPKTSAALARPGAAGVAVYRRPARFQLAVAKKNPQPAQAGFVPLEMGRSPIAAPHLPAEPLSGTRAADEQAQRPASPVAFVDRQLASAWKSAGIEPSPLATDEEWIRRVYLDVLGHIPPEEAVDAFLDGDGDRKRAIVVDRLLEDPGYARNWATVWTNLLVGRQPRTPGVRRDELEKFLRDSFAANVPWNEIVYALVSAEGTADRNPAANFLLAHLNQDAVPATALTARLFLGTQVQCTQCHDHPFSKDKQDRFWELNSFFQQTEVVSHAPLATAIASMEPEPISVLELVTRPVGGPIYYETRRGEMRAAFPVYGGQKIDPAPTINRRRELGRLIARGNDRQLARAMVNRTWQHFFKYGFTRPVDDMGPHNAPSHPDVLDRLANDFVAANYNLKALIRWICATDAYRRASALDTENSSDDPASGASPLFSRVYLKPLTAEELYDSLLVATRARSSARTDWSDVGRRREDWVRQFVYSYATEENDEASLPAGSVSQALTMMNDRIVEGALAVEPGTLLYDVAHDRAEDAAKIRRLSRSALSRNPTRAELRAALSHLREARGAARSKKERDQSAANVLADIFWAYLNANEFALVH